LVGTTTSRRAPLSLALLFVLLAAFLVFLVKWDPYYQKLGHVLVAHTLGPSIVSGTKRQPPPVSLAAGWSFFVAYLKAIWQALLAGLILGSGLQVLVPRDWIVAAFGKGGARAFLAGALAVPSMMCTCCSAPLAVGLLRRQASASAVLAYWVGNPVLNPATIVFLGLVLGWRWAVVRIVLGVLLVAAVAGIGRRFEAALPALPAPAGDDDGPLARAWSKAFLRLAAGLLPEYLLLVFVLGALRGVLFPAVAAAGGGVAVFLLLAAVGTLFVIPTAGEVPILQTFLSFGLGPLGAGALLLTLPAVSLPSLAMLARALPLRLLAVVAGVVFLFGILSGLVTAFWHLA
jgi:uncharacterized membrane protein YraQ (UPF0718 family)